MSSMGREAEDDELDADTLNADEESPDDGEIELPDDGEDELTADSEDELVAATDDELAAATDDDAPEPEPESESESESEPEAQGRAAPPSPPLPTRPLPRRVPSQNPKRMAPAVSPPADHTVRHLLDILKRLP